MSRAIALSGTISSSSSFILSLLLERLSLTSERISLILERRHVPNLYPVIDAAEQRRFR